MLNLDWSRFHRDYPLTSILLAANMGYFVLFQFGILPPAGVIPGSWAWQSWGGSFFHYEFLHLAFNCIMLIWVGTILEKTLNFLQYLAVLLFIWTGTTYFLVLISSVPAVGFSGILLGMMSFVTLWHRANPIIFQTIAPLLCINIIFGLFPGVSWWGHAGGALSGLLAFVLVYWLGGRTN